MKKNLLLLVAMVLVPTSGFALTYAGPLLQVTKYSGYVPPEYRFEHDCQIFSDKVVIERKNGNYGSSVETKKVDVNVPMVMEGISEAAMTNPTIVTGPTDGSTANFVAYAISISDVNEVVLKQSGMVKNKVIESPAARTLVRFIEANCK